MNEEMCIVTSRNLYEFSQINNNEMGILIHRGEDSRSADSAPHAEGKLIS